MMDRTKNFTVRIIKMAVHLPETEPSRVIRDQILRSGTSIASNYRAACRSKSQRDFINKLKIVEEEADETLFWLDLIEECELIKPEKLKNLKDENEELLSIIVASLKTAKETLKTTIVRSKKTA